MNSAPGNPWTNTETPDDAPFSERGFGNLGNGKPAAPSSTASMKDSDNEDSVDKGGRGFLFTEKDDDKPPENPAAGATEHIKGSTGKEQKSPASDGKDIEAPPAGNAESTKLPNSKKNSRKGKGNNGKGRKGPVFTEKDDEPQEQPTTGATDERMPKIAAIPSKDSPSGIPQGPSPITGGTLASYNAGSVASRVKALDNPMPSRPSMDSRKTPEPSPSQSPLPAGPGKTPESTPKDSPPSSTNSTAPSAPSSLISVGIPDVAQSPREPLSRKPSPLLSGRGSIKSDTHGATLNQTPSSVERDVSNGKGRSAVQDRAPSPEQTVSRKPSHISCRSGSIQSGSNSGVPSQPRMSMQWDGPSEDDSGMEFPNGSREMDNPPLEPAPYDDLYDASPQASRSRLSRAMDISGSRSPQIDIPGPRSPQESGSESNVQPTWDTSTDKDQGECTELDRLCDDCSTMLTYISSSVPNKYLLCSPDMHPVTLKCTIWGTVDYASDVASSVSWYLHRTVSQDIRVHAAVRRAASASHREGRWYDVTSPDIQGPVYRQPSRQLKSVKLHPSLLESIFWPGSWSSSSSSTKALGKECDRRPRDLTILIDFPMPVDASVERYITSALPNTCTRPKLRVRKSHRSFHRLMWWARTHPAQSSSHTSSEESSSRRHRRHSPYEH